MRRDVIDHVRRGVTIPRSRQNLHRGAASAGIYAAVASARFYRSSTANGRHFLMNSCGLRGWRASATTSASLELELLEEFAQIQRRSCPSVAHRRHRTIVRTVDLPRHDRWSGFAALALVAPLAARSGESFLAARSGQSFLAALALVAFLAAGSGRTFVTGLTARR